MIFRGSSVWIYLRNRLSSSVILNESRCYGVVTNNRFVVSLHVNGLNKLWKHHEQLLICTKWKAKYSTNSDSTGRRMDLYCKTDETVRKWNDFYIYFRMEREACYQHDYIEYPFCQGLSDGRLTKVCDIWIKGDIVNSFVMFSMLYEEEDFELQQKVLTLLQCLIFQTLRTKTLKFTKITVEIAKKFAIVENETCIMITVWYALFVSPVYSDWEWADNIMRDNLELQCCIDKMFILFGYYFLKSEDLNNYHRLIEVTLKYDKERATSLLLSELFNYYCLKTMPRRMENKKRSQPNRETIAAAVNDIVKNKISFRAVEDKYCVAKSALARHVSAFNNSALETFEYIPHYDTKKVFSVEQEQILVEYLEQCSFLHYGLTFLELRKVAFQFAKENQIIYPSKWDNDK